MSVRRHNCLFSFVVFAAAAICAFFCGRSPTNRSRAIERRVIVCVYCSVWCDVGAVADWLRTGEANQQTHLFTMPLNAEHGLSQCLSRRCYWTSRWRMMIMTDRGSVLCKTICMLDRVRAYCSLWILIVSRRRRKRRIKDFEWSALMRGKEQIKQRNMRKEKERKIK